MKFRSQPHILQHINVILYNSSFTSVPPLFVISHCTLVHTQTFVYTRTKKPQDVIPSYLAR